MHCRFDNYIVENDSQQRAVEKCRKYAENFSDNRRAGRSLMLIGNRGTGKNHLGTAIAKRVMRDGFSVLRIKAMDFLRDYWGRGFAEQGAWIADLARVDLLVIDEVGRHSSGESAHNALFELLDARSEAMTCTVLLSNKNHEEIREIITQAGWDRLREGGGQMVRFTWDSYRGHRQEAA